MAAAGEYFEDVGVQNPRFTRVNCRDGARSAPKIFRVYTGRKSAAGENFYDFRAISEGKWSKKGTLKGLEILKSNKTPPKIFR